VDEAQVVGLLVRRCIAGDSAAWEDIVQRHHRRIYNICYRFAGTSDDAQDLTQEVFIKALQRQDQLKDADKAAHWLSRIATNTAIDHMRRNGRVSFCELDSLPEPVSSSPAESPEQVLLRAERQAVLEDGLQMLTARERAALLLRDVEGLPAEEVARHLNCSKATVRSHIANARVKFRRYLSRRKP
jgi:RNA polymerase sigma-70 factor (ECF subfamily)